MLSLPPAILEAGILGSLIKRKDLATIRSAQQVSRNFRQHAANAMSYPGTGVICLVQGLADFKLHGKNAQRLRIREMSGEDLASLLERFESTKDTCMQQVFDLELCHTHDEEVLVRIVKAVVQLCPQLTVFRGTVFRGLSLSAINPLHELRIERLELTSSRYWVLDQAMTWSAFKNLKVICLRSISLKQDDIQELASLPHLLEVEAHSMNAVSSIILAATPCTWTHLRLAVLFNLDQVLFLPLQHGVEVTVCNPKRSSDDSYSLWEDGPMLAGDGEVSNEFCHKVGILARCLKSVDVPLHLPCESLLPLGTIRAIAPLFASSAFARLIFNASAMDKATAEEIADFIPHLEQLEIICCMVDGDAAIVLMSLAKLKTLVFDPMEQEYHSNDSASINMGRLAARVCMSGGEFIYRGTDELFEYMSTSR